MENQGQQVVPQVENDREPTLEELGLHSHCINCVLKRCHVSIQPGVSCSHMECPFSCGAYFHECKADDHSLLCPNVKIACVNSSLGCQTKVTRELFKVHLRHCPAHVIMCGHSVAADEMDSHYHGDHEKHCEPVLAERRKEWLERMEGKVPDIDKLTIQDNTDQSVDSTDQGSSSAANKKEAHAKWDPLHTVPWQLRRDDEEAETENEGETPLSPTSPAPLSPAPFSPLPEESLNLCQLPYGILQQISLYLNRETLHELALVSHFMRQVAASLLKKKGLVETKWKKVDGKWAEDGKIWRYVPAHLKPGT
ncbi:uncharacterized protein [Diadema setosum]|uniref:uncharacterized protein n=1 Tax=Diadema setosum TaxID=31175 RepID=UPI003B3B0BF2